MPDQRLPAKQVVDDAIAADVRGMLFIGSDLEQSAQAISLANTLPDSFVATVGVHPHYAKDAPSDLIEKMSVLAKQEKVVAVGECGLDFNRNFSPRAVQLDVFEAQLSFACQANLPVYLHERDAFEQQLQLLKKYQSDLPSGVAHCFTGNARQAEAYLELGLFIGVTGWVCDPKRGRDLKEALSIVPLERLLLETDAPYLWPKTLKSQSRNNVPANLPHIAEAIAQIKQVEIQDLKQQCWRNTMKVFDMELASAI